MSDSVGDMVNDSEGESVADAEGEMEKVEEIVRVKLGVSDTDED